jgi:hypothetical protein
VFTKICNVHNLTSQRKNKQWCKSQDNHNLVHSTMFTI